MAKSSGLGITVFSIDDVGGTARAVVNDLTNFGISTPRALQDITGLDKSARERLHLLSDAAISGTYVFNDLASTGIFTVMKDFYTTFAGQVGRTTTITFSGGAGAHTLANELLYDDFPVTRATDGSLGGSFTGHLSNGTVPTWS